MKLSQRLMNAGVVAITSALAFSSYGIVLGQVDDFQDGTAQGWTAGQVIANAPLNLQDIGPLGDEDHVLAVSTNGKNTGAGSKLVALNRSQWLGDYLAAGVTGVTVDLSTPNVVSMNVRLGLRGPGGDFVTPPAVLSAGDAGTWDNFTFNLEPAALLGAGGTDAALTLANVTEFRLLHNRQVSIQGEAFSSPRGGAFAATLLADNVTAVPEPLMVGRVMLAGLLGVSVLRRRQPE